MNAPLDSIPAAPRAISPQRATGLPWPLNLFLMTSQLHTGGTERQFVLLAKGLRSPGCRVELGCLARAGSLLAAAGEIAEFPVVGSFLTRQAWRSRSALAAHLRARRIAVAHSFDFYGNMMLIPVARTAGVPVVLGSMRSLGDRLNPLQFEALLLAFRLCDRVVCNSHAAARKLAEHGLAAEKLTVIPNALPSAAFGEEAQILPRPRGRFCVGMIGRMNERVKNQETFLRAGAILASQFPQAEFVLAGDGPLRSRYEQMAQQLGIAQRVRFLGDRRDVTAVLASLDVSVVPSLSESLSNVVIESMAAGKAVVASRVGGNLELIEDGVTGRLVMPQDHEGLAQAITGLLRDDAQRHNMAAAARRFARENFGLEQICGRYMQLYEQLLERKSSKSGKRAAAAAPSERVRLRVAIVAPSTRILGGQSVQAGLLTRLWRDDADADVRLIPVDPDFPAALRWAERVPLLRTLVRAPIYVASLWHGLADMDVAHIFSASYWSFLLAPAPALLMARKRGAKTVLNYRSGEARDHLSKWRMALPFLKKADRVVVPSRFLRDVFAEFGLRADIVPNLVDLTQFTYRPRRPLLPRLVCTRGFEPYYDVDLVVRAFARVQDAFPAASLCLVGSGSLEQRIRATVRELQLDGVEFTGAVARDRIGQFYDRNHVFVNASWLDNMPVSLLEAFAAGTPVVTTAPDGIRYIVEHERTGLLCAPKDWQGLAENVLRLLRNPDFALGLARNAYEESRRYRWQTVRGQWLEVYRSACGVREADRLAQPAEASSRPECVAP